MFSAIITKIFGNKNERDLKQIAPIVQQINDLEPEMARRSDIQLAELTVKFRERLANGETLDDILPEAFAADFAMTAAEGAKVWAERLTEYARNESTVICVAEYIGQLIGMAGIGRGHWPKTRHSSVLWGVYVKPDWRGWHIAEAIIDECSNWAHEHGVMVVKLGVITTNASAIRCYSRCGFKVYGTDPMSNYYDGVYYDELLMVKLL